MTIYLYLLRGRDGPIRSTEIRPEYTPPMDARNAFTGHKVKTPPMMRVKQGEDRSPSYHGVKHGRCDTIRRVERVEHLLDIQEALDEQDAAWDAYVAAKERTQAAMRAAWPLAKSVTVAEVKAEGGVL